MLCAVAALSSLGLESSACGPNESVAPVQRARVVAIYPHDRAAFTQGLVYAGGLLYESTGLYGQSRLRQVELGTGAVRAEIRLPPRWFGEGLMRWRDWLVQLTWRAGIGLIYDAATLTELERFTYSGEGWGLTHDGARWILSDGSDRLRLLDPSTRQPLGQLPVRDGARPLQDLNELEFIEGEIWANLWRRDCIARVDATTGRVNAFVDLSDLWPRAQRSAGADVLNGIAHDARTQRIFVTGKLWPRLYQIEVDGHSKVANLPVSVH